MRLGARVGPAPAGGLSIEHKVAAGFGAALLVLAVIAIVSYRSVRVFVETARAVETSQLTLRRLEEVVGNVADAEAGTRGFVITGNPEYLTYYRAAWSAIGERIGELRRIAAGDPPQQARIGHLDTLVTRRLEVSRRTVELRAAGNAEAATALVRSGRGRALTDTIRGYVDGIQATEIAKLNASAAAERAAARRVTVVTASGLVLALLLAVAATIIVRRDVDQRVRAEREMRRAREAAEAANRAKSEFLARMSHELRTPLNSVIGFSNVLLENREGNLRPLDLAYLERIATGGRQLLELVGEVLDLSKIEVGRMTVERVPVALDALVRDLVLSFEGQLQRRDLALRAVLPERLEPIAGDPTRLQQVLLNLVGNAIKFTEHGSVTIAVEADPATGRPLRIDVADTGIGIVPERAGAIFEAFEQADAAITRRFGGTGLGLTIARALCGLMGYELELAWSEPGRGSVFSVRLAADAPRFTGPPATIAPRAPGIATGATP